MCRSRFTSENKKWLGTSRDLRSQECGLDHPHPRRINLLGNMDKSKLRFTPSHEWVSIDGATATIGITDYAIKTLTDLVYIDLPQVGRTLAPGESFGEVESVKAVSELLAPVGGEIIEVNDAVADDLNLLADDPFGQGWLIKIRIAGTVPTDLLDAAAYEKTCEEHG